MKYFVGGILYSAREADVERYMKNYGKVVDVAIMREKHSGRSRGFAFVTFEVNANDPHECENLDRTMLEENRHSIGGRNVEIR
jgi:heterogeneous nuclear ribonucleoprotein A1/A3